MGITGTTGTGGITTIISIPESALDDAGGGVTWGARGRRLRPRRSGGLRSNGGDDLAGEIAREGRDPSRIVNPVERSLMWIQGVTNGPLSERRALGRG